MKLRRVAALFRSSQSSQTWNGFQHVAGPVLCCPLGSQKTRSDLCRPFNTITKTLLGALNRLGRPFGITRGTL
ncbi:hypothetical protein CH063_02609 [Colletotrichum higginsianum]|uniref:Uncharacterized protein n=1 Tax=Colletotrichum higginsianum (strain IMI 349063) TaxID=759273 RepID=H1VMN0_COLHI|nr:hypothetical protein CH063_02609 [Colletotrichum higginsianum]